MTIEETKKAIAVMQAYVDGKTIETRCGNAYTEVTNPRWNWFNTPDEYRIKTESHYRPFESAEEVMEAIKKHGDWVRERGGSPSLWQITGILHNRILFSSRYSDEEFKETFESYTFVDGTPFGKLEE